MFRIAAASLALALMAAPALADPGGSRAVEAASPARGTGAMVISPPERELIQTYFNAYPAGPHLPPGIRKNLARGKPLPPGISRKLPEPLAARLPRHPGYAYQMAGADVVLVEIATGLITDMLEAQPR